VELRGEDLSCYLNNIQSASLWKRLYEHLSCQQSLFQRYHSEQHLSEFYLKDGGKSQLASKLRYYHLMYNRSCAYSP